MNTIKAFIDYWNKFIDTWYKSPSQINFFNSNNSPWEYKKNLLKDVDALPEPYCGDPYNLSAIILNLNPGGVTPSLQLHPDGAFIKSFVPDGTYWNFAQSFPYLTGIKGISDEERKGEKWWKRRDEWINRLIASINRQSQKKPFAIDICPWHSKSWGRIVASSSTINYVNDFVIKPAEIIINNADLKIILCVGKPFILVFKSLKFTELLIPNLNLNEWPKKKNGKNIIRNYSIWKSPTGVIYINTYSPGTNSAPSNDFVKVESYILQFILNSGYRI